MQFPELKYTSKYDIVKLKSDTSIAYTDEGSGDEVLVFIHGLASYLPSWQKIIPLLKNRYRCIAIDLPGYGKSQEGAIKASIDYYSDIVSEFIKTLELKNVTLVGHSMGGQISISAVIKYPELIKKLILLAPAGIEVFEEWERNFIIVTYDDELVCAGVDEVIRKNMEFNFYNMPADTRFLIDDAISMKQFNNFNHYREVIRNCVRSMLEQPVSDKLYLLTQPVLIIFGANDYLIPNRYLHKNMDVKQLTEQAEKKIPHSETKIIPECGHYIQLEKPEDTAALINSFLLNNRV